MGCPQIPWRTLIPWRPGELAATAELRPWPQGAQEAHRGLRVASLESSMASPKGSVASLAGLWPGFHVPGQNSDPRC